ncbi:hypothetical protein SAMD00019534_000810 [Acytostelium subglobosum LB1]|uniref:hypothetical protein n=1 Tax=Acytostelium subglobosum LB1 TaxID=1410327 RepID=UPI000644E445|nr:hypothetical protein SAMD00019534_000810 [Acytostelium subglobosum LB1]GAM16906.1 hypothetical protein SAMD00019534_000810 [Acytostelium subglobosum LB1]|eukprot:XP_012758968.1 hypothetical protein SAMD00019534_000810 [Acytostelium subglobosum LB1]
MLYRITDILAKYSRSYLLLVTSLSLSVYIFYYLNVELVPKVTNGRMLDSFIAGYTAEEGLAELDKFTRYERSLYKSMYADGYDVVLPFTIAGVLLSLQAFSYPLFNTKPFKLLMFIPLLYMISDLSENFVHYQVLVMYENGATRQQKLNYLFYGGWFDLFKYITFCKCYYNDQA